MRMCLRLIKNWIQAVLHKSSFSLRFARVVRHDVDSHVWIRQVVLVARYQVPGERKKTQKHKFGSSVTNGKKIGSCILRSLQSRQSLKKLLQAYHSPDGTKIPDFP